MKKLKVFVAALGLLIAANAGAQIKIGYISVDNVVGLMPETAKVDSLIQQYQADSLQPRYNYTLSEYLRKDSIVNGKDSLKTPAVVRAQIREEMQSDAYQLQNWQSIVQQATESKQNEFLAPIYKKVLDAVKAVAKEKNYTHVFNKEAFLVAPDGDDMLLMVAEKLKIKLPNQTQGGLNKTVVPGGNKKGNN
ncbi:MAG TPA: OmpH family outer membrane protein [Chitinophagaceae bacterium]|nr:OmpH family outer membrane protein [Chitinophagaceae bacterium]